MAIKRSSTEMLACLYCRERIEMADCLALAHVVDPGACLACAFGVCMVMSKDVFRGLRIGLHSSRVTTVSRRTQSQCQVYNWH